MNKQKLNGIYLVVDPMMDQTDLLDKIEQALEGGVGIIQIWNHWSESINRPDREQFINYVVKMAEPYDVPVLINDSWELLNTTNAAGVHFDSVPRDFNRIRQEVAGDFIAGITCSNNPEIIEWAEENDVDYISFCAMFPSPSVGSCEIVRLETVKKARELTDMPLFLSGGMTPEKIKELRELDFDGVAVISGILKDENPREKTSDYKQALKE